MIPPPLTVFMEMYAESDGLYLKPSVVRIINIETAVTASNTVVEGQSHHGRLG